MGDNLVILRDVGEEFLIIAKEYKLGNITKP